MRCSVEWHTDCTLCKLHGTESQERDCVETDVQAVRVVCEGDEAVHTICESGDLCICMHHFRITFPIFPILCLERGMECLSRLPIA